MPFEGLTQGIQAAGSMFDMYNAPQLNQLNLLQQQAKLEQLRGLDPVSQLKIKKYQAALMGSMAKLALENPENRDGLFNAFESMTGMKLGEESRTEESLKQASMAVDILKGDSRPQVGRFKQSVVGGKLVLVDSVTGDQQVMDLQPGMEAPESFTDEQKKQWESLPPASQQKIIEKNLDPNAQLKTQEKLKSIQKKDQFKKVALELVDKILGSDEIPDVLGPAEGSIDFRLDWTEAELIADIKELESILTGENLDLMTGVLSESDIAILRQIGAGGLDRRRTPKEFKRRLEELKTSLSGFDSQEAATPKTQEEFDKLPVGSFYIDPADNRKYRKK